MEAFPDHDTRARRTIATFDRHRDAQELVDWLADRDFPVDRLAIVGSDPHVVEQVTGRLDAWRALVAGAGSGAVVGAFFGLLFGLLFSPDGVSMLAIVLYWLVVATTFGALLGVVGYAFSERRGFTSESAIVADRYEVMADHDVADQALQLIRRRHIATSPTTEPTSTST